MVDWNAMLEWAKSNYIVLIIAFFTLVVFIVMIRMIVKHKVQKPKQNISLEIYARRQEIRELDVLLGELEGYFRKVETRMVRK